MEKTRLFLSTDTELSAEEILSAYAKRWSIESMFNQLKLSWGLKEAWQQKRQTLHRWVHITMVSYGLIQLLAYIRTEKVALLCCHGPWRKDNLLTAGKIRTGLQCILRHVHVRSWWQPKCRKFEPPNGSEMINNE